MKSRFALLRLLPALLGLAACSPPNVGAPSFSPAERANSQGAPGAGAGPASVAAEPGRYLASGTAAGAGACLGLTLADVLDEIRALEPGLADIQTIYSPANDVGDGDFIYPYARVDGGFAVVFKRGLGDCPAGCTENDYLYFATDAGCLPTRVGHFHAGWGDGACLTIEGAPMWSHPPPPDPLTVCGLYNGPGELSGTYTLHAVGTRTPCTAPTAAAAKASVLAGTVTLVIQQSDADQTTGTVTFAGTGHALVDGVALPARFQRRRFDAERATTDSYCPRASSVTARYDFEGFQPGGIEVTEQGDDSCTPCKGSMTLTLGP